MSGPTEHVLLQVALDAVAAHIAVLDEHGTIVAVNRAWREFAASNGAAHGNAFVGWGYLEVCDRAAGVHADEAPAMAAGIRDVLAGRRDRFLLEYPCHPPRGRAWFQARVTRFDAEGRPHVVVAHENITEVKLAEQAGREAQERYRRLVETIPAVIYEAGVGPGTPTLFVSPQIERLLGLTAEQVTADPGVFVRAIHPDDRDRVVEAGRRAAAGGEPYRVEFRMIRPDGRLIWVRDEAAPVRDASGAIVRLQGVAFDITDGRLAEEALRESERRNRLIFEQSSDALCIVASGGRFERVNPAAAALFGVETDRLEGSSIADLAAPPGRLPPHLLFQRLRGGEGGGAEMRFIRADGADRVADVSARDLGDGTVLLSMRDTTERIEAQAALARSEELHRLIAKATDDAVYDWSIPANTLRWNESLEIRFGHAPAGGVTPIEWWEGAIHPEDRARVSRTLTEALAGADRNWTAEYRFRRADGGYAFVLDRGHILRDADGKPVRMIGAMLDLSDRIAAEEALRVSEARYRILFEDNPNPMWVYDVRTLRFLEVNDAAIRQYGYSREEFLALDITRIRPEADVRQLLRRLEQNGRGGADNAGLWRHRRKDGSILFVEVVAHDTTFDGKSARFVLATDVTERVRAERALRDSEERYRVLAEHSSDMISRHSPDGAYLYVSPASAALLGYEPQELVGRHAYDFFHPGDLEHISAAHRVALERPGTHVVTYRIRRKDSSYAWFETTLRSVKDPGSDAVREIICVSREISERKRAEDRLRLLNRELEHRVKNNLAAVQVLADQTLRHAASPEDFSRAFRGRVQALSRMQDLFKMTGVRSVAVRDLVSRSLEVYTLGDHSPVHVGAGADVRVDHRAASVLNMALHELATNAVKHGSLAAPGGRVDVQWALSPAGDLILDWRETGGPPVLPPRSRGFGLELIEGSIAFELAGKALWDFAPAGLRCEITVPASSIAADPPPEARPPADAGAPEPASGRPA